MGTRLPAVLVVVLGAAVVLTAQSMVEYSTLSTHSSGAIAAAPNNLSSRMAGRKAADHYGTTKGSVWQEKNAHVKDENPSKPTPPAVFVLSNGERLESADYFVTTDSLRVNQHGQERTIPMSELNRSATVAANRERGVELRLPDNKAQITISF